MSKYVRKTIDTWEIQGYWGSQYGWECECTELTYKEARARLKEYRENQSEVPHRIKLVREKIKEDQNEILHLV